MMAEIIIAAASQDIQEKRRGKCNPPDIRLVSSRGLEAAEREVRSSLRT